MESKETDMYLTIQLAYYIYGILAYYIYGILAYYIYGILAYYIYGNMTPTAEIAREETRCVYMGYSFRLAAMVLLYAPSHRQDNLPQPLLYQSQSTGWNEK